MQQKQTNNSIIIFSSARKAGNTAAQVTAYIKQNPMPSVCLDDYNLVPYRYDKNYAEDDFKQLFESLLNYQHWVFASPVYWYNTTVQMKIFIDRITDYMDDETLAIKLRTLREKQFSLLSNASSAEAPACFVEQFKNTFSYLGMQFINHSHISTQKST